MLEKSLSDWNVREMPLSCTRSGRSPATLSPLSRMSPEWGSYNPLIRLNVVVLPEPLGPMIETISFSRTVNARLSTALRPPKLIETSWSSSTGSIGYTSRSFSPSSRSKRDWRVISSSRGSTSCASRLKILSGSRPSGRKITITTMRMP